MAPPSMFAKAPGTFPVRLPGHMELDVNDCSKIWGVHPLDVGDDSYIVEFKTSQDAARYEKAAQRARKEALQSCSAAAQGDDASSSHENGTVQVEIIGLPLHLMNKPMMEATLDQGGLDTDVLGITFLDSGKVHVAMSSKKAAKACVSHFHGRKWNSGVAVSAHLVSSGKVESSKQSGPQKTSPASSSGLNKHAPAYIHSSLVDAPVVGNRTRAGTSDASTTVSDEAEEDDMSWEADLRKVMSGWDL